LQLAEQLGERALVVGLAVLPEHPADQLDATDGGREVVVAVDREQVAVADAVRLAGCGHEDLHGRAGTGSGRDRPIQPGTALPRAVVTRWPRCRSRWPRRRRRPTSGPLRSRPGGRPT